MLSCYGFTLLSTTKHQAVFRLKFVNSTDVSAEKCTVKQPVSLAYFRNIFNTEFHYAFYKPTNDLCSLCDRWNNLPKEDQSSQENMEYRVQHLKRKKEIRAQKEQDKSEAQENLKISAIVFGLQKVLQSPKCNVSDLYYSYPATTSLYLIWH